MITERGGRDDHGISVIIFVLFCDIFFSVIISVLFRDNLCFIQC